MHFHADLNFLGFNFLSHFVFENFRSFDITLLLSALGRSWQNWKLSLYIYFYQNWITLAHFCLVRNYICTRGVESKRKHFFVSVLFRQNLFFCESKLLGHALRCVESYLRVWRKTNFCLYKILTKFFFKYIFDFQEFLINRSFS